MREPSLSSLWRLILSLVISILCLKVCSKSNTYTSKMYSCCQIYAYVMCYGKNYQYTQSKSPNMYSGEKHLYWYVKNYLVLICVVTILVAKYTLTLYVKVTTSPIVICTAVKVKIVQLVSCSSFFCPICRPYYPSILMV